MELVKKGSLVKVLTVEDSLVVAKRVQFMLDDIPGVEFTGNALNASEALYLIDREKPHVVILDIQLGKHVSVNGIDLLVVLRKIYPDMKIIMLTNLVDVSYRTICMSYGADYFFDKSNDFDKVSDVLKKIQQ